MEEMRGPKRIADYQGEIQTKSFQNLILLNNR
jgi:hypothetical protein